MSKKVAVYGSRVLEGLCDPRAVAMQFSLSVDDFDSENLPYECR
jgi:hypothetical protein